MIINLLDFDSTNFCIAPWTNLHISLTSDLKPCCFGANNFGKLKNNDWSYINGTNKKLIKLKNELINGQAPTYCTGCLEKPWYNEFKTSPILIENINDFNINSIDVRWGNTCQLTCTYCDDYSSSSWGALKNKFIPSSDKLSAQTKQLLEFINLHKDRIKRAAISGGEPLLLKENNELLHILNEDTKIEIITNLNIENLQNNLVYQQLSTRNNVTWHVSMENVEDRFEFVRHGSKWDLQVQNLKILESDVLSTTDSEIQIHAQYCVYSALNIIELVKFVQQFTNRVVLSWSFGMSIPCLNFAGYPLKFKRMALEELNTCMSECNVNNVTPWLIPKINSVQSFLNENINFEQENIVQDCIQFHHQQERAYFKNQKFTFLDLWPQFR